MVCCCQSAVGSSNSAIGVSQALKCLGRGHLVDEMPVDVEENSSIIFLVYYMILEDFVVESAGNGISRRHNFDMLVLCVAEKDKSKFDVCSKLDGCTFDKHHSTMSNETVCRVAESCRNWSLFNVDMSESPLLRSRTLAQRGRDSLHVHPFCYLHTLKLTVYTPSGLVKMTEIDRPQKQQLPPHACSGTEVYQLTRDIYIYASTADALARADVFHATQGRKSINITKLRRCRKRPYFASG